MPRHRRLEITERIDAAGKIITPLEQSEIAGLVQSLRELEVESVAVTLLFSFLNDTHERQLGEALRQALPDLPVFLSCEVLPEVREFERTSTTAVCAYVGPIRTAGQLSPHLGRAFGDDYTAFHFVRGARHCSGH